MTVAENLLRRARGKARACPKWCFSHLNRALCSRFSVRRDATGASLLVHRRARDAHALTTLADEKVTPHTVLTPGIVDSELDVETRIANAIAASHLARQVRRPNDVRIDCKAAKHSEQAAARHLPHMRNRECKWRDASRAWIALAGLLAGEQTSAALSISCSS